MAQLGETYDTETMEFSSFELIPANTRAIAQIVGEEDKQTRSGGRMLTFTWEILDGPYESRRIWTNYNYVSDSQKAQSIAREQFGLIAKALNIRTYDDTEAFHNKPMLIDINVEQDKTGQYRDRNGIKNGGYHPIGHDDQEPAKQVANTNAPRQQSAPQQNNQQASQQQSAPRTGAGGGRPWDRR